MFSRVLAIAWREFKHTALTKAFIFGAVVFPAIIMACMVAAPLIFQPNVTDLEGRIVIIDASGNYANAVETEFAEGAMDERVRNMLGKFGEAASDLTGQDVSKRVPTVKLTVERAATEAIGQFKDEVRSNELEVLAVYPANLGEDIEEGESDNATQSGEITDRQRVVLYARNNISPNHLELIKDGLRDAAVRERVATAGKDLEEMQSLMARPGIEAKSLDQSGGESTSIDEFKRIFPIAFLMLIWITTFTSANYLLTSTIEEKSNKVIEVLLSAVSPMQLMTGKILGQALVSLVMLIMYAGTGIAALVVFGLFNQIPFIYFIYTGIYFVMAYFMIAAMFAGIGSAVNELREAQSLVGPAMMVLMIPLMLWFVIQENPNGILATVTSFIPPLTPFVMIMRVTSATEVVPTWQIIAATAWGTLCTIAMVWMAAKIFRVGVLMYGKPPSPLELLKWVRYS